MTTSDPLRVALTVEQLWQRFPGGSGTYIRALARRLVADPAVSVSGISAWHRSALADVPVRATPLPRRLMYDSWSMVRRPRSSVPPRTDVVHATTWAVPPARGALVVTVHDLAFLRSPEHFTARGDRFFRRALQIVRAEASLVLTPSHATAADCVEVGIPADRVRVTPLGVDPVTVTADQVAQFRRARGLDRPYVLWCGTLEPRKNVRTLIRAFREVAGHTDLDLVLVGPTGWGDTGLDELDQRTADRVHRLGWLGAEDLQRAYAGARVFTFPSLWEGFGLPVLEAMAHGTPVVTSAGTSMAEFTGDAGLLVDPRDPDELAAALMSAGGDRHAALGSAATAIASEMTWERTAALTVAAYREAAASGARLTRRRSPATS